MLRDRIRAGIVGYRGYAGAELLRILERHPGVQPVPLEHREGPVDALGLPVVLLATPSEVSHELAPPLLAAGARVIDLSDAFRLRTPPDFPAQAVYGLPEFCRERIPQARLVANPGCYPTAANLAMRPLLDAGVIDRAAGVVCDAKSGVSGAGRKPSLHTSFCEVTGNLTAYALLKHRHVPEMLMISGLQDREFSFTAQLLPVDRGILETIYFRARHVTSAEDLLAIYSDRYAGEPFIRIYPEGQVPDLRGVVRTNYCDIGVTLDAASGRAVVVSAIDNLLKGAAGQAVQNLNLLLGFPESEALL
jgi:N-acetyl-gamma-glutamyl-phosphate reductase